MTRRSAPALLAALTVCWLSGCATTPESSTSPRPAPAQTTSPPPADLAAIPDAIPRVEPRSRYGNPASYEVFGQRYVLLPSADGYVQRGTASWYGPGFHEKRTSSGEPYDMYAMTAAHKTLPIPVYARVTHLGNGRSIVVRINDRGPFVGNRIIDLSYTAAWKLDMLRDGTAPVEVRVLSAAGVPQTASAPTPTPTSTDDSGMRRFVQAGAFSARSNAEGLVARLNDTGINNVVVRETGASAASTPVFRVQIGPMASTIEVDDYLERLRLLGISDARAVSP